MIKENIAELRANIAKHAKNDAKITLVAVTKNHGADAVKEALAAGVTDIGENRVQEAKGKFAELLAADADVFKNVRRHLIGHLQTNKAKEAVRLFDIIHSVDSVHLLAAVAKAAQNENKRQDILIQVNLAGEAQKSGVSEEELPALLAVTKETPSVRLCGLMLIAPAYDDAEKCRELFAAMRRLFLRIKDAGTFGAAFAELSMGMSGDYGVAIEEGATMIRVGTAIFGARNYGGR